MSIEETLDYAPNHAHIIELNITPAEAAPTWAWAQRGILECAPESDETISEDAYYHNLGNTETSVDSIKVSIAITGHRWYGDPVQDYVQSLALLTGKDRKTQYRWTMPDGSILTGDCTITELVPGSSMGEANAKGEFGYRINLDSTDLEAPGDKVLMPTSVTATASTVAVGKTVSAGATVTPAGANQRCHYAIADTSIATVNAEGTITGVKAGKTKLTVKAASKPSVLDNIEVTVSAS
ncbi:MAG: Ig-like domain-containing protein [Gordonibacter sp.]